MKLIIPKLVLTENEGFTRDKDIFQRKKYAETLTSLIENVDDELVIALDAPWGEGKTTFVKMWIGMLNKDAYRDRIKTIYFDAYKNDFLEDPMLVLAGEVNNLLEQLPKDKVDAHKRAQYTKSALKALKVVTRAGVRISLRALTAGVIDDTAFEGAKVDGEAVDIVDEYLSNRLLSIEEDRQVLNGFQQTLKGIVNDLGDNAKLIFFVDELDRCKPSFALDLLETIKHIFSVPGVVFVLVTHKVQMQEIIRTRYGEKIESLIYLQKFIHLWAELPRNKDADIHDGKVYTSYCLQRMDYPNARDPEDYARAAFFQLADYYNLSFRDIERSITNFAIYVNATQRRMLRQNIYIAVFLSIIKLKFPTTFQKLCRQTMTYAELIKDTELERLIEKEWNDRPEGHELKWHLRYQMCNDDEVIILIEESGGHNYSETNGPADRGAVNYVARILSTLSTR
jgi:hypothetical protein